VLNTLDCTSQYPGLATTGKLHSGNPFSCTKKELSTPVTTHELRERFNLESCHFMIAMQRIQQLRYLILCALALPIAGSAQSSEPLGIFDQHLDIGNPEIKGTGEYNKTDQTYSLNSARSTMKDNADQFHFAFRKVKGDFMIRATVRMIGGGGNDQHKAGIIARDQLTADSRYAGACVRGDVFTALQYRTSNGAGTEQSILLSYHPTDIELERVGNTFTLSAARFGENYKSVSKEVIVNEELYAGLFFSSQAESGSGKAVFSNVQIIIPPAPDYRPYRDYIGSHLEIMEVATGKRKILHSARNSLQAPNWTKDDKLIFNSVEGPQNLLYVYDLKSGNISKLNTGFATNNNNDHVLSFDQKMIAISNHVGEKRISTLFTLPVGGSDNPTKITDENLGHSFLHGWSPDGKKLVFTGQRNNAWDIWTIDIASKKETRLTEDPALDDGPEYTPDGKYIYFNSVRTGTMKLWRMKPDGSGQEQITFDEYNDWFPHFSPDGKWMVYISFPKDIDPASHPFYKKCYLRLMPAEGGVPKTIAYIYGGQGTINVPSWSPDGKMVAFVSNSN
jgi:TolB protein